MAFLEKWGPASLPCSYNLSSFCAKSSFEGSVPETVPLSRALDGEGVPMGGVVSDIEQQVLLDANLWVIEQGLPEGELTYELVGASGELLAVLDLAWPEGIQEGYSQPVALLIDEDATLEALASQAGFRLYTSPESLKSYVEQEILAIDQAAD